MPEMWMETTDKHWHGRELRTKFAELQPYLEKLDEIEEILAMLIWDSTLTSSNDIDLALSALLYANPVSFSSV